MLKSMIYNNSAVAPCQKYAKLYQRDESYRVRTLNTWNLELSPRKALAYHHRTSDMLITIIYNNWEMTMSQNYAEISSKKLQLSL